jgi:hypothetical protein
MSRSFDLFRTVPVRKADPAFGPTRMRGVE